jgi:hypothetical protein
LRDFGRLKDLGTPSGLLSTVSLPIAGTYANRTNMSNPKNDPKNCTHIKVTGIRCGSPALGGEQFCYFHRRMLRCVKGPDSRLPHVALLENEEAVEASILKVVNALIAGPSNSSAANPSSAP